MPRAAGNAARRSRAQEVFEYSLSLVEAQEQDFIDRNHWSIVPVAGGRSEMNRQSARSVLAAEVNGKSMYFSSVGTVGRDNAGDEGVAYGNHRVRDRR